MQPVLDYLKQNQSRFLAEFCEYLRFPSVSAQPQHKHDVRACAEWLVAHCRQIGLEARLCETPGHPVVVAKTPATGEPRRARPGKPGRPHYGSRRRLNRELTGRLSTRAAARITKARISPT